MFEVDIPVPGSTLFCFSYSLVGTRLEETAHLFAHSFGNTVRLHGSYFHSRCRYANVVCFDSEDVCLHRNTRTFLVFAPSPLLPANNRNKQTKTKKSRWQRSQREPETKQQERQVVHTGVFFFFLYTSEIIMLIITGLQPKNN